MEKLRFTNTPFHIFIFMPALPLRRITGIAALGGLETPHDFQKSLIVLLAPHPEGITQGRRCSHTIWSLDDIWATFSWV